MSLKVNKAAVVGAGTMGGEIAFVIASAGIPVILKDVDQKFIDHGIEHAEQLWAKLVAKEKLTQQQADAARALITGTLEYHDFGDVDFVIEAVPERMSIKQAVFAELDAATPGHAILASNTSALSIDEIAEATTRPDQVVGFHFFYPAGTAKLIEVIEGLATAPETTTSAYNFAQAIKKAPITCADSPGFVVNRLLCASMGEMHRVADEHDLAPEQLDSALTALKIAPTGPCALSDMLGLDTVLHVLEHLNTELGDDFYVPPRMKALVESGNLGVKTGKGFYDPPGQAPEPSEPVDPAVAGEILLRSSLRMLVEACEIIEEGVGNAREIDLGMMMGAAVIPGPLARADEMGLDNVLAALTSGVEQWGSAFEPPALIKRLVAQGRTGKAAGHGFFAYPNPDDGEQAETVLLETRGDIAIAWLAQKPVNPISPALVRDLTAVHAKVEADPAIRALVIASSTNVIWSAGADLKAFAAMTPPETEQHVDNTLNMMRGLEKGSTITIAAVNGAALGGGCELAMSADIRIAGESAGFGQPEIALGILPGFGGTQRLPRLVGKAAAFEMIAAGDQIDAWRAAEIGLVNEVVPDHELIDAAVRLAKRLAAQAPLAIAAIKDVLDDPTLDEGIARERAAFIAAMKTDDAREGVAAFIQKRAPKFTGG